MGNSKLPSEQTESKAGYTAGAIIWAGAVRPKTTKKKKKVKCDGPTDGPMDRPTKRGVELHSTRLKILPTDGRGKVKSRVFRQKKGNGRMKLQGMEKDTSKEEIRKIAQKVWILGQ